MRSLPKSEQASNYSWPMVPKAAGRVRNRLQRPVVRLRSEAGRLRPILDGHIRPVVLVTVLSVISGLAEAGVLLLVANVAAAMVLRSRHVNGGVGLLSLHATIGVALLVALALALLRLLLQVAIAWLPARISADVLARLRRDLFDAYSRASWPAQSADAEGYLQEMMTDQATQAASAVLNLANVVYASAMFATLLASAFAVSALVASVVLATSLLLFALLRPIDRHGRRAAQDQSRASIEHARRVSEAVRLTEEMHVFGSAAALRARIGTLIESVRSAFFRTMLTARLIGSVYQSLVILLLVAGLALLYMIRVGDLAALGAVVLMLVRVSAYGQQIQSANHLLIQTLPYVTRMNDTVTRYRASAPIEGDQPLGHIRGIAFDHVDFAYVPGRPVLHDVCFELEAGEAVGIIGPTGAGKSTLSQILLRLREPSDGLYLIDGKSATAYNWSDWQRRVAYIPQEPRVLHASVADNIRFFRQLERRTVEEAARLAHIHDEITTMPDGYDTIIGERAEALSGGQRQRICLARALAGRPGLLLLDEPTSALDLLSEAAVRESLSNLRGRVTLIVVAHRLPLLDICDRVLVLEKGRVKAFNTVGHLAVHDAFYREVMALATPPA